MSLYLLPWSPEFGVWVLDSRSAWKLLGCRTVTEAGVRKKHPPSCKRLTSWSQGQEQTGRSGSAEWESAPAQAVCHPWASSVYLLRPALISETRLQLLVLCREPLTTHASAQSLGLVWWCGRWWFFFASSHRANPCLTDLAGCCKLRSS